MGIWEYFILFLHGLESFDKLRKNNNFILLLDFVRSFREKNNFTDMNRFIDALWYELEEEEQYETERNLLLLIDREKTDGLSHPFDFYLSETGITYCNEKLYSKALPYFEEALAINPSGIDSTGQSYNYSYGSCMALCSEQTPDNWNKIIGYMDRAMGIMPDKPQPLAMKGACLYYLHNYNEAIACLTMALENKDFIAANTDKGDFLVLRAICWYLLGMKDKANKDKAEANRMGCSVRYE